MMGNRKALFIGIGFYDYEQAIIAEFNKLNYDVDYFSEVPPQSLLYRIYTRLRYEKGLEAIRRKHCASIAANANHLYDQVFIIKAEYMSKEALSLIKNKNPNAKFVLYLWDSLKRFPVIKDKFPYFDKIYSFDRQDCLSNQELIFNALFFRDEYAHDNKASAKINEVDVYHLGWYHSDRLRIIKQLASFFDKEGISYKMLLYVGYFSYLLAQVLGGDLKESKKFLIFKPLSAKLNFKNIKSAIATVDIAHEDQSGLTMRTIELLGGQKKIITTNADIVNYDFYDPQNILIINRENVIFNIDFFKSSHVAVDEKIVSKYSIHEWLKRMLD